MTILRVVLAVFLTASLTAPTLHAQEEQRPAATPRPGALSRASRTGIVPSSIPQPRSSGGGHGALIGAIIGGAGATAITYLAAKSYGENEGGEFCGGCFLNWGVWAIPAGAVIGGVTGALLSRDIGPRGPHGRQTSITPALARRGGAVVVAVRY